jgi:putative ABC transport system permease protein
MRIVGVVETQPLAVMGTGPQSTIYTFADPLPVQIVRLAAGDVGGGVAAIDNLWQRLAPGVAIERRFVDDFFNQSYENFARINQTFAGLTSLALLISTIGLFSMALLVASSRTHEIGVRKTLGASTRQMIVLLLKSFSGPVLVANVIAWPLAFMMARTYLNAFIYPIDLTPLPFVACLVFTLAVAWLVVAAHTYRAAALKPANVLRAE